MGRVCIGPTQIQNWVGEFSAVFLVESADAQENLRDDVLIEPRKSRRRNCGIFPRDPARGVGHATVFSRKPRARQTINRGRDVLLLFGAMPRRSPELAGFSG